jgi:hypothetical protein
LEGDDESIDDVESLSFFPFTNDKVCSGFKRMMAKEEMVDCLLVTENREREVDIDQSRAFRGR